jgi:hypothetical protein
MNSCNLLQWLMSNRFIQQTLDLNLMRIVEISFTLVTMK